MTDSIRRKDLKLAYELALPRMRIFSIRNRVTGRMLLDQSTNLTSSLNRHRLELSWGVHRNQSLMADWREYGEASFSFEVIEEIQERSEPHFDYGAERVRRMAFWKAKVFSDPASFYAQSNGCRPCTVSETMMRRAFSSPSRR